MARPRKPDEIHILDGTFRADRHGDPTASIVADGEPIAPTNLRGKAREFWDQVVPGLISIGLAKACDTPILVAMCRWWALAQKLANSLDRMPLTDKRIHARIVQAGIAHDKWTRIAAQFGLDVTARSKLRAPAKSDQQGVRTRKRG